MTKEPRAYPYGGQPRPLPKCTNGELRDPDVLMLYIDACGTAKALTDMQNWVDLFRERLINSIVAGDDGEFKSLLIQFINADPTHPKRQSVIDAVKIVGDGFARELK